MKTNPSTWVGYLARFHAERAGITGDLLSRATDTRGATPYSWLADLVPAGARVLDLACGSAPLGEVLGPVRYLGLDLSPAELRLAAARGLGVAQADAARLPLAGAVLDVVTCSLSLQVLPLGPALAEVRRVLVPGGTLVATVPTSAPLPPRDALRWARLLVALGKPALRYPNDRALARAEGAFAAAGMRLVADEARGFEVEVLSQAVADQLLDGLYLPQVPPHRLEAARRVTHRWVGQRITVPVRRLVATT